MSTRFYPFALLLSVLAHLGLGWVVSAGGEWVRGRSGQRQDVAKTVVVHVVKTTPSRWVTSQQGASSTFDDGPGAMNLEPQVSASVPSVDSPVLAQEKSAQEESEGPSTLQYFTVDELTVHPILLRDIAYEKADNLPSLVPYQVRVQLLINDQGGIDKVVIEPSAAVLPEVVEQFVLEAFAALKFSPGKIGDRAVGSQLNIEINLDRAQPSQIISPSQ